MSKLQEKIELYTSEVEKLGLGLDIKLLAAVAKGLGPSIYKDDAEKVSSSDKKELEKGINGHDYNTHHHNFYDKRYRLCPVPTLEFITAKIYLFLSIYL